MTTARLEILVEPFRENDPGPHVAAVMGVLEATGLPVDMGPFSTTVEGDVATLVAATAELLAVGFKAGATAIQTRLEHA